MSETGRRLERAAVLFFCSLQVMEQASQRRQAGDYEQCDDQNDRLST